jgi:hypothetical protein
MTKANNVRETARKNGMAGRSKSKLTVSSFFAGIGGFDL